jgi:FkbM family methyltransferase
MQQLRKFVFSLMKVFRRLFRSTGLHQLPVAVWIYKKVMSVLTSGDEDFFVTFRGMNLAMEPGDVTLLPSVVSGDFEVLELDWYESWLERMATSSHKTLVVDIGSNIGIFSVLALGKLSSDSKVVSIEPDPRNLRRLGMNLDSNVRSARNEIMPIAVGDTNGFIQFSLSEFGGTNQIATIEDTNTIEVACKTLDQIFQEISAHEFEHVLVKIDVEGFEPLVVSGGMESITKFKPKIMLEVSRDRLNVEHGDALGMVKSLLSVYSSAQILTSKKFELVTLSNYESAMSKYHLATLIFE